MSVADLIDFVTDLGLAGEGAADVFGTVGANGKGGAGNTGQNSAKTITDIKAHPPELSVASSGWSMGAVTQASKGLENRALNKLSKWGDEGIYKGYGQSLANGSLGVRSAFLRQSGFSSVTEAVGMGIKGLPSVAKGAAGMAAFDMAIGVMAGDDITVGKIGHSLSEGLAMDLSFRMAGSLAGGMGWSVIGGITGMSSWQTTGAMAASYLVGGKALLGAIGNSSLIPGVAYLAGKGAYAALKGMHALGKRSRQTDFSTGDLSFTTANAATMRQRALGAIQNSHMNARAMLGNEASTYARAIGF